MKKRIAIFQIGATDPTFAGGRLEPLLRYLVARGHKVTFVTPELTARRIRLAHPGIKSVGVCQPLRSRQTRGSFVVNLAAGMIHALCLRIDADVCIALTGVVSDVVVAQRLARRCGAASVGYVDNMTVRTRPERTWWTLLDRIAGICAEKMYSGFDRVFAGSKSVAGDLAALGVPFERIHVTGYGVGGQDLEIAKRSEITKIAGRAVFVGRFSRAKGIFDLLGAWPAVVHAVPHATLHIMGIGDDRTTALVRRSAEKSPAAQSISFLGFTSAENKFRELLAADVMIFPTYSEQYSQAVAEALACRVRVVGYDIEGFRDNFPGLIDVGPTGDIESLIARSIKALVARQAPAADISLSYEDFFKKEEIAIDALLADRRAIRPSHPRFEPLDRSP